MYLGLSVKRTDAGATVYIPDANVTVTGSTSRCQDVWLPRTPGQSLECQHIQKLVFQAFTVYGINCGWYYCSSGELR